MRVTHAVILTVVCLQFLAAETPYELNSRGVEFFRQGRYAESEKAYREAITLHKRAAVLDVNAYAAALNNLAGTLQTDGRVAEARTLLTEVVSLDAQIKGEDLIVTHALNNLALIHQADGQESKAIALLKRALERTPSEGETRAGTLHNLGASYLNMGQDKKARELFEASLQMHTKVGAVGQTPATLGFLALLAGRRKDYDRAFVLLDRSLTLRREIFGPTHPLVALGLNDIGELYRDTERYEEAAAAFEESLQTLRASVGANHAYAAPVLYHYGECRRRQGRHAEALQLFQQAIQILESTFGPNHSRLANIYKSAAWTAAKLSRKGEAKEYTVRAQDLERDRVSYGRHTVDVSAFTGRN